MLIKAHLPCDHCGSSDALAIYSDRTVCFSCKYSRRTSTTSLFETKEKSHKDIILSDVLPMEAKRWLLKSRIYEQDIKDAGIRYNEADHRVMLPLGNHSWQGRSLKENDRVKYLTYGPKVLPLFAIPESPIRVLTEDWCSAYRINKAGFESLSILGTSVKINDLIKVNASHKKVVLWLDGDKPGIIAAQKLKKSLSLYFNNITIVSTELDPKLYSDDKLKAER